MLKIDDKKELMRRFKLTKHQYGFFSKYRVDEDFIDEVMPKITSRGWDAISGYQNLSWDFIDNKVPKSHITNFILQKNLPIDKIEKHMDDLYWATISSSSQLTEDIVDRYQHKIEFDYLIRQKRSFINEQFLEKYEDRLNWNLVSMYQRLSQRVMNRYADKLDWEQVSGRQKMSVRFIEKYKDKIHWGNLLNRPMLKFNSDFLEKHIDKVNEYDVWKKIHNHNLDVDFVRKYQNKIVAFGWDSVFRKVQVDEEIIEKQVGNFANWVWGIISSKQKLSIDFIIKYSDKINFRSLKSNKFINQDELNEKGVYVMAKLEGRM